MSGANGAVSPGGGAAVDTGFAADADLPAGAGLASEADSAKTGISGFDAPAGAGRAGDADGAKTGNGGFEEVLDVVRRSAADLLREAPHRPSVLRVRAGDVAVEMEWAAAEPAASPSPPSVAPASPAPAAPNSPESSAGPTLNAPMVGVFYVAPEPGAPPFVSPGDRVAVGQQVAIIEAMKLMVPVHAEQAGVVARVLVADGTPVEYGDALFALEAVGR